MIVYEVQQRVKLTRVFYSGKINRLKLGENNGNILMQHKLTMSDEAHFHLNE